MISATTLPGHRAVDRSRAWQLAAIPAGELCAGRQWRLARWPCVETLGSVPVPCVLDSRGCDGGGGGRRGKHGGSDHAAVFLVFLKEGPDGVNAWRGDEPLPGLVGGVAALQEHLRGVDAADAPHAREPLDLAALAEGEPGRVDLDLVDGGDEHARALLVVVAARPEVGVELRHADGAPDAPRVVGAARVERRRHLVNEAAPAHLVDAAGDEVMQHGELCVHPEEAALVPLSERAAVPLDELLDVRVGAARDDGHPAPRRDAGRGARGLAAEVGRRELGVRVHDAQQVVRHPGALRGADLVGGDVQAGVRLDLVGVDDLAAEAQREVDRQAGLAGARGAQHHDGLVLGRHAPAADHRHRRRGVRERDRRRQRRQPGRHGEAGRRRCHRGGRHGQWHVYALLVITGELANSYYLGWLLAVFLLAWVSGVVAEESMGIYRAEGYLSLAGSSAAGGCVLDD